MLAKIGLQRAGLRRVPEHPALDFRRRAARRAGARAAARAAQARRACAMRSRSRPSSPSAVRRMSCAPTRGGEAASLEFSPKGCAWCAATAPRFATPTISSTPRPRAGRRRCCPIFRPFRGSSARGEHAASRAKHGIEDLKRLLRDESAGLLSICRRPDRVAAAGSADRVGGLGDHGTRARRHACRARRAFARRVSAGRRLPQSGEVALA